VRPGLIATGGEIGPRMPAETLVRPVVAWRCRWNWRLDRALSQRLINRSSTPRTPTPTGPTLCVDVPCGRILGAPLSVRKF